MATYKDAGVDIDAGNRAVSLMKAAVEATHGPEVLGGLGSFGGLYDARGLRGMEGPVLVASTDGVGTKTRVAAALGRFDGVGHDIVNHCVNDILVQGARPLFFLDYFASAKIDPEVVARVVSGAAAACKAVGCALLGGETAEMPGVYAAGEFDLVGTLVGVVERGALLDGRAIQGGDVALGLASAGLHTNGFSLARKILPAETWGVFEPSLGRTVGDALLEPHRCYLPDIERLRAANISIRGMAHITGGGLVENPPRVLPAGLRFHLRWGSWPVPPLFALLVERGQVAREEALRVFNMGVGMLVVVPREDAARALEALQTPAWELGVVEPRPEGSEPVVWS
jgi:phosphoribosylformylglycinamidine cyclo-ligase